MIVKEVKKHAMQEAANGEARVPFSTEDRVLLERYFLVAEMISRCCGSGCEVLIYSYEDYGKAIIKIINGHVSGRSLGDPITEFGLKRAKAAFENQEDITGPYLARTMGGALLKGITMVIRNEENRPIGAFCINIDLSIPMERFVKEFLLSIDQSATADEILVPDLSEKVATVLAEEMDALSRVTGVSPSKRINLVTALECRAFSISRVRGAWVGNLGGTRHTIYKYLRNLKTLPQTTLETAEQGERTCVKKPPPLTLPGGLRSLPQADKSGKYVFFCPDRLLVDPRHRRLVPGGSKPRPAKPVHDEDDPVSASD
jgi:predicted transcriptional regulator YheO